ncbi:MAG TPA: hypothetical protein VJV05_08415 [Pyrinomonadaceae bacterium]|nr:hypothetical protein [Pyrinomonadaceae bacterium]
MKRKLNLIAITAMCIGLTFITSVHAQTQVRAVADTGIISIGPNQILRISGDGVDQDDAITLRFRRIGYAATSEDLGITKFSVVSSVLTNPILVNGREGVSMVIMGNLIGTDAVRVIVMSNRANVRVNAALIDAATGNTQVLIALLIP